MTRPVKQPCSGCGGDVLHIEDVDTGEPLVLDAVRVDEGDVVVYAPTRLHAVARRYGRPARVQPAFRVHVCPSPTVATRPAPEDPYEDKPAAAQQHGGWRA